MSTTQYFVTKGRTVHGPTTGQTRSTNAAGRITFGGIPGKVFSWDDNTGKPVPLPASFVDYASEKVESNKETLLDNLIRTGFIVLEAGGETPVEFAPAMGPELTIDAQGQITQDAKK